MSVWWALHRDDWHPAKDTVRGTLVGKGTGDRILTLDTVERISTLIPAASYLCRLDYWYGGGVPTYEIIWPHDLDGDGEPDRDRLLFHPANAVRNFGGEIILRGCVAPGMSRAMFWGPSAPAVAQGLPGVTQSVAAFRSFMAANFGLREFMLRITGSPPASEYLA